MTLSGKHILVTSGPTQEPIDPVRYLSNHSSGKQGHAIAAAFAAQGARVTLVSGPVSIADPKGVTTIHVKTAKDMLNAVLNALPADVAVCAAAVADWTPANVIDHKMKKRAGEDTMALNLVKTADILKTLSTHAMRPTIVVGFAAETDAHLDHAREKLETKKCDLLLVNDVSGGKVFGADETHIHVLDHTGTTDWGAMRKDEVATKLVQLLSSRTSPPSSSRTQ